MSDATAMNMILEVRGAAAEMMAICDRLINKSKFTTPETIEVSREKRQLLLPSNWPRAGGREFTPSPSDLFESDAYRTVFKTSGHTRAIYVGACEGLANIARMLHLPLYKVSTCASDRLWVRMKELRQDKYGAVWLNNGQYVADQTGWTNWFPSFMAAHSLPSQNSPVRCEKRAILVALPAGMTPEDFDRAFDAEVAKGALDRWLLTDEGRNHAATLQVDPSVGQRLTAYRAGDKSKLSPATEIGVFCTKFSGPDRLIAIAENIILRHLRLID